MESLKRVRTRHFQSAKEAGEPFTGLTSYDMLTAQIFDEAGIPVLLVGDSAGAQQGGDLGAWWFGVIG